MRASHSVSTVGCPPLAAHVETRGTAFATAENQALTAYHVVRTRCAVRGKIALFGGRSAAVAALSPANGLALLRVNGYRASAVLRPAPAHIGEHLALLGYPNARVNAPLRVTYGRVVDIDRAVTLNLTVGTETLKDAIVVSAPATRGESGGPAVDGAGRVVGVIQGGNSYITVLTPAVDLTSLHARRR